MTEDNDQKMPGAGRVSAVELSSLPQMVRTYPRGAIESFSVQDAEQNIIVPPLIYQPTKEFVNVPRESRGIMLAAARPASGRTYWIVEYMQTLGYGDSTSVFPNDEKRQAFVEMMKTHGSGMKTIEYHAHTTSAGSNWFDKFSGGDLYTIVGMLNSDPSYVHALFTPTNVLTIATKETSFKLARDSGNSGQVVLEKFKQWQEVFKSFLPQEGFSEV